MRRSWGKADYMIKGDYNAYPRGYKKSTKYHTLQLPLSLCININYKLL